MLHRAFDRMQLAFLILILCFTYQAQGATTPPPVQTTPIATTTVPMTTANSTVNSDPTLASPTSTVDATTASMNDSTTASMNDSTTASMNDSTAASMNDSTTASMNDSSTSTPSTVAPDSTTNSSGNSSTTQSVTATESSMGDNSSTEGVTSAVTSPETTEAMNVSTTPGSNANSTATSTGNSSTTVVMTSPTPTMGGNSSMTGNMSEVTSPTTNSTMNDTASPGGNETSTMSSGNDTSTEAPTMSVTQSSTTMAPTTAPPTYPSMPHNTNTAVFRLNFNISDGGQITSPCNASVLKKEVEDSFNSMNGYLYTITNEMSGMTAIYVYFRAQSLLDDSVSTANATRDAFVRLNNSECLNLTSEFVQQTSAAFAASSMMACEAEGVCPVGYSCQGMGGCQHLCAPENCSGHGTCYLNLTTSRGAVTACSCGREGMYYYGGDKCENQILHPDVIIAIIAGILGSVCFILFVILIIICIRRATANTSKYEMNGHFNEGYQEHSLSKL